LRDVRFTGGQQQVEVVAQLAVVMDLPVVTDGGPNHELVEQDAVEQLEEQRFPIRRVLGDVVDPAGIWRRGRRGMDRP